jgi:hypothetical protein
VAGWRVWNPEPDRLPPEGPPDVFVGSFRSFFLFFFFSHSKSFRAGTHSIVVVDAQGKMIPNINIVQDTFARVVMHIVRQAMPLDKI